LITQIGYDTDGSVIFSRDPLNRQTSISYEDSFSDGNHAFTTFAYPTKVTPPIAGGENAESFSSTTQYNYYFGAVTRTQGPIPAGQTQGPVQTFAYDAAGRISRVDNLSNGAWKYWAYPDR
jgi:YD repeat-containing protein